jgi:hypothetical protein
VVAFATIASILPSFFQKAEVTSRLWCSAALAAHPDDAQGRPARRSGLKHAVLEQMAAVSSQEELALACSPMGALCELVAWKGLSHRSRVLAAQRSAPAPTLPRRRAPSRRCTPERTVTTLGERPCFHHPVCHLWKAVQASIRFGRAKRPSGRIWTTMRGASWDADRD